ncbi:hypothetical protein F0365_01135 [Nonlabens sp. Ci31]|jgi:hypothetical protein|uniref:hypothetical protein n=1 Tax=Nonlabens sp. Ci31 TaxID=2608253 RepID=UPI001463C23F|nr:hypothetical protein [Nonlabens sp. Ci31]QJP33112.1 hypothetical protein F0365_01135 [Nonlabens sp. Ci31]
MLLLAFLLFPALTTAQKDDDHPFHVYAYSGYGFSVEDDTNAFDFSIHSYFNASYDVTDKFDVGVLAGIDYNVYTPDRTDGIIDFPELLVFVPVGVEVGYSVSDKFRWTVNGGKAFNANLSEDSQIRDDATFIATNFAYISKYAYGAHVGIKSYNIGDANAIIIQLGLTIKLDLFDF